MMFVGRLKEIALLQQQLSHEEGRLVVLYGRRRVGKTALVDKAFEKEIVWKFEGLEGQTTRQQIKHFLFTLQTYVKELSGNDAIKKIATWQDAFSLLEKHLPREKPMVVFFDEFQWSAGMQTKMVSVFKWSWDNFFSKRSRCCFVLCGSVSSFIVRSIVKSTALYGRIHCEMHLLPFSLLETAAMLGTRTPGETIETFMVFGGIPYYLKEIDSALSPVQNIQKLAFTAHGFFFGEHQRLFISHFAKNPRYEHIMRSLARAHRQTQEQLAVSLKQSPGGTFSRLLEDLALAGFIEAFIPVDKEPGSKLVKYRLQDEFLHFYYQFIEKNRNAIEEGTIKSFELLTGPRYAQWRGYAFERLCMKHASSIANALGFSGIRYKHGSWFRSANGNAAQIDLLFRRADTILTVCEIKWSKPSNLSAIVKEMDAKLSVLKKYIDRPVQKVLIVGENGKPGDEINSYFDKVLFAEKVFFI